MCSRQLKLGSRRWNPAKVRVKTGQVGGFWLRRYGGNMARITRNLVLALSVAMVVAACGRKSDLQKPLPPPDVQKDANGKPDRPFVLDPILGK